jgi:tetratricopeptide (TPR) repeat protein
MSERLIYHSSVGFSIAVGYFLFKAMEIIKPVQIGKAVIAGCMVVIIALCGMKTIARNKDWKTNYTLFPEDLKVSQNSVMLNAYVAAADVDKAADEKNENTKRAELHEAVKLFDKAISLDSTYVTAYLNRGLAYYRLGEPDSSYASLMIAKALLPNHSQLPEFFYNNAVLYMQRKQYDRAMNSLQISLKLNPNYTLSKNAVQQLVNAGLGK